MSIQRESDRTKATTTKDEEKVQITKGEENDSRCDREICTDDK